MYALPMPTHQPKCIRLGEETCMRETANTFVEAHSLRARKRVGFLMHTRFLASGERALLDGFLVHTRFLALRECVLPGVLAFSCIHVSSPKRRRLN